MNKNLIIYITVGILTVFILYKILNKGDEEKDTGDTGDTGNTGDDGVNYGCDVNPYEADSQKYYFYVGPDGRRWSLIDVPDVRKGILNEPKIQPYLTGKKFESEIKNIKYPRKRYQLDLGRGSFRNNTEREMAINDRFLKIGTISSMVKTFDSATKYYGLAATQNIKFDNFSLYCDV